MVYPTYKIKKASTKLAFNYLFLKKLQQFNRLLGDHEFFVGWNNHCYSV